MIANFLFFLKIIRVFKKHNILKLIEKNIRYKFLFKLLNIYSNCFIYNKWNIGIAMDNNRIIKIS